MTFKDKYGPWALIAGAAEGLGAALAMGAAERGCDVVMVDRSESKLTATAAQLERMHSVRTRAVVVDLEWPDAAAHVLDAVGDLEVGFFVYNAAAHPRGLLVDTPDDELMRNIHVNCSVPTLLTKGLAIKMVKRGRGGIALCSSGGALNGLRVFVAYGAAKAYELLLAEGLWDELRGSGVDVMGYVIGMTLTPTFRRERNVTPEVEATLREFGAQTPEECAARFYDVFGSGPRGYAHDGIEQKFAADAQRPRAEIIAAMGEYIQREFG